MLVRPNAFRSRRFGVKNATGGDLLGVFGPGGAGKTTLLRTLAWDWLEAGRRVIVFDTVGRAYESLLWSAGGSYIVPVDSGDLPMHFRMSRLRIVDFSKVREEGGDWSEMFCSACARVLDQAVTVRQELLMVVDEGIGCLWRQPEGVQGAFLEMLEGLGRYKAVCAVAAPGVEEMGRVEALTRLFAGEQAWKWFLAHPPRHWLGGLRDRGVIDQRGLREVVKLGSVLGHHVEIWEVDPLGAGVRVKAPWVADEPVLSAEEAAYLERLAGEAQPSGEEGPSGDARVEEKAR